MPGQRQADARPARRGQRGRVREVDIAVRNAQVAGRSAEEHEVSDRTTGALGDEVGVQLRVVPEIAPVGSELLVTRDRQPGEARRASLVLVEAAVKLRHQLEIVGLSRPDLHIGLDRFHRRGLAYGPDVLDAEGEPQPRIHERLVARRDQRKMPGRAGRYPARRERGIEVANRFALALGRRAACEVDDRAPVAQQWILLDAADQMGDHLVAAERDNPACLLVIEITLQLGAKVRELG